MAGEVKTQGTAVYFVDRTAAAVLVKMEAPTGVSGLTGGAPDPIETTNLNELSDRTYEKGLNSPTPVTFPFNLKPADASHQLLFEMKAAGTVLDWGVLLSDGVAAPTLVGTDPNKVLTIPATRTGFTFKGYISEVNIDIATNEIVRGTLVVQRSGAVTPFWK